MKTALIIGAAGQDGQYLSEHLTSLSYRVFRGTRRLSWESHDPNSPEVYCDIRDGVSLLSAIRKSWPDEIYNLAGQVYVPTSWDMPAETFDTNTIGLARILMLVEQVKRDTKVYQASSSEMFGNCNGACTDATPMNPTSPYGISKMAAHRLCRIYRDRGLYVVSGILFNHESPRRSHEMVTRKIARKVAEWAVTKSGEKNPLVLGNMLARRDWGFAGDYVKAMHLMLQQNEPTDYVVGTGESHSVSEFLEVARLEMALSSEFVKEYTVIDPRFVRTQEIYDMKADSEKIKRRTGWEPEYGFRELVRTMVWAEFNAMLGKKELVSQ
jgi:GDPmannose 4,6-dehydratase